MLKVGSFAFAKWTNCNNQYEAKARIIKENKKTWVVELLQNVIGPRLLDSSIGIIYPIGHKIQVPKIGTKGNCLIDPKPKVKALCIRLRTLGFKPTIVKSEHKGYLVVCASNEAWDAMDALA